MLTARGTLSIPTYLPPATILGHPDYVKMQVEEYFSKLLGGMSHYDFAMPLHPSEDTPIAKRILHQALPTPEGFAHHMGFASFKTMQRAIEDASLPERSRHYVLTGCGMIADAYTKAGLTGVLDKTFLKFLMSAYLNISEKTETHTTTDARLVVSWATPQVDQLPNDIVLEMERLENALPDTMRLPMKRPTEAIDITSSHPTSDLVQYQLAQPANPELMAMF